MGYMGPRELSSSQLDLDSVLNGKRCTVKDKMKGYTVQFTDCGSKPEQTGFTEQQLRCYLPYRNCVVVTYNIVPSMYITSLVTSNTAITTVEQP